jgi:nicotinamide/nicotinate riboside kinase
VGLSGVSCGGKTTVARGLSNWLGEKFGSLIMQDDYYRPASELPINTITNFPEFDEPESVRMDNIVRDIKKWKDGKVEGEEPQVLVVEGTMIFTCLEIAELCDLRYLIHIDYETAKYRRSLRNYPIPDPPGIVAKNIWPKYIRHRSIFVKSARKEGLIARQIDGTKDVNATLAGIINDLKINKHSE